MYRYPAFPLALETRIAQLEQALYTKDLTIGSLINENRFLREQISNRLTTSHSTQTEAAGDNSVLIVTNSVRKSRQELQKSQIAVRNKETREAFESVAKVVEGGEEGDIQRVWVCIHYKSGEKVEFWAKEQKDDDQGADVDGEGSYTLKAVQKVLQVKVKNRISYSALHELRMCGVNIPPVKELQKESERLATCLDILPHPHANPGMKGNLRRLQDILELVLPKYHQHITDGTLLLRLAADGAKITKHRDSVRCVIKILANRAHLTHVTSSPDDELTLFFFMGKESQENMRLWGSPTFREIEEACENGLVINDHHFKVKCILSSDWKAMSLLKGINPANSKYFCLWCECSKAQIRDFSVPQWPVTRSKERQTACLQTTGVENRRGYQHEDLLPWIPYPDVVPDELHLRMRITGLLLNQVVRWSIRCSRTKELCEQMRAAHVDFNFYEEVGDDNQGKVHKWTQPAGDALNIILKHLDLVKILGHGVRLKDQVSDLTAAELKEELSRRNLPTKGLKAALLQRLKDHMEPGEKVSRKKKQVTFELSDDSDDEITYGEPDEDHVDVDDLQEIWKRFDGLMDALKAAPGTEGYMRPSVFQETARAWARDLKRTTFDEAIIPYIHCLVYHVPQALERFQYLPDIGISQVERKNYDHHLAYFGATSREGGKHGKSVVKQILERENMLLHFNLTSSSVPAAPGKRRKLGNLNS